MIEKEDERNTDLLLSIENLCAGYDGKPVFCGFSLDVKRSEKILVTGANGCGKTTLLKTILGIIKPVHGTIKSCCTVAYCKQNTSDVTFPITVKEVVAMADDSTDNIRNALKKTNTLHLQNRLFNTLSGGERQRVSLARCFCQQAELVLLDEPTSFLDTETEKNLVEILHEFENDDVSIIAVTHNSNVMNSLNWRIVRL
ncbi:MAG: ATP-binding cassette domain-containing protein [Sphaerochaetaceae bacterium]|nr:ATP-binding cassette domain-containing protein [Sphaerochaetaceae bacterium]